MHSWHILTDNMGSGKSPTKQETQRISFLLAEVFRVSEIHRRLSKFSLKAMRRWCQKLKAGLPLRKKAVRERRVELPIAKEVADGLAGQKALSSGTLGTSLGISRTTAWRLLRGQHGRPYKRVPVQSLTEQQKVTRLHFCRVMLLRLNGTTYRTPGKRPPRVHLSHVLFSDEKLFRIRTAGNSQNERVWSTVPQKRMIPLQDLVTPRNQKQRLAGVMVGGAVHAGGLFPPAFIPVGVKMCSEEYQELVSTHYLPRARALWDQQEWRFQQDNAPSHVSKKSLAWFKEQDVNLLGWPPVSPDLNPLDYSVWSTIEARVQRQKPTTVDHLRKLIVRAFDEFSSADASRVVGQFVKRLQACVAAGGSWFEHTL